MLKGTVTIPFIKQKASKKLLLFVSLAAITHYYLRKGNEVEDALQLVIGAPGRGQVSITNPNPPSKARRAPVPVPMKRPRVRRRVRRRTKTFASTYVTSKPTNQPGTKTLGSQILDATGQPLTTLSAEYNKILEEQHQGVINAFNIKKNPPRITDPRAVKIASERFHPEIHLDHSHDHRTGAPVDAAALDPKAIIGATDVSPIWLKLSS